MKFKIVLLLSLFLLTGCWDKVEIENRAFALSLGIDKFSESNKHSYNENKQTDNLKDYKKEIIFGDEEDNLDTEEIDTSIIWEDGTDNRFTVTIAMPKTSDESEKNDDTSTNLKISSNSTISSAMNFVNAFSNQKTYFGHTKLAILGEEILKDEKLFRECIDVLERNPDISRKILMLGTDGDAKKILEFDDAPDESISLFITNFYKNNTNNSATTFKQTLENLVRQLRETGNTIIPKISIDEDTVKLAGGGLIKDLQLVDWLTEEEMKGYLFVKGEGRGANLTARLNDALVPLNVTKNKTKIFFKESSNGQLECIINVKVQGNVEEYKFSEDVLLTEENLFNLEYEYKKEIENKIENCISKFEKYEVDGFFLKDHLYKYNYDLYGKYENKIETYNNKFKIVPLIEVDISETGTVW